MCWSAWLVDGIKDEITGLQMKVPLIPKEAFTGKKSALGRTTNNQCSGDRNRDIKPDECRMVANKCLERARFFDERRLDGGANEEWANGTALKAQPNASTDIVDV